MWQQIIYKKIVNQSRALAILGLCGTEKVMSYALGLTFENIDYSITDEQIGGSARRYAKEYFNRTGNEAYSF